MQVVCKHRPYRLTTYRVTQVRVDIFVGPRGAPHGCMVNEISLTSGSKNAMHGMYMAHLWAEVHASGAHATCGKSGQKVYDLNECGP